MSTRAWWLLVWCVFVTGCRDLTLPTPPPPPGPGLLTGRLVWQPAGRLLSDPASGARVYWLGTSVAVTADEDGRFVLEGLTSSDGSVLMRFDSDGDGSIDRQRSFRLADLGAGLGREVSLGDVLLGRAAQVSGKLRREDVSTPGGHAGTSVFVPGAPFVTSTGDDGSFVFEALPEGPVRIAAFRASYAPFESGDVSLRAGERFSLSDGELAPTTETGSLEVRGRVLSSSGAGLAGVSVTLGGGDALPPVTTDASGNYTLRMVPQGRYDARFELAGSSPAALYNVVAFGSTALTLPDVVLSASNGQPSLLTEIGGTLDAGVIVVTDGGSGTDGGNGTDGGGTGTDGGGTGTDGGGTVTDSGVPLCATSDGGAPLAFLDAPALADYGERVLFSAGRSIDPDCLPLRYRWTVLDGGGVPPFADDDSYSAVSQSFVVAGAPTEYVLRVEVVDDQGLTARATTSVRVTPRPRVDAGVDFPTSVVGRTVTLDASGSQEELGRSLSFTWRLVSGPGQLQAISGAVVPLLVNGVGPIVLEVKVCHLPQHCSLGFVTVQGIAQNQVMASIRPATPDPLVVTLGGAPITLEAVGSTTTGQDSIFFSWQAPNGNLNFSAGSGQFIDVTGISAGDWPVQLMASTGMANTMVTRTVRVLPAGPPPLTVIDAGVSALSLWMAVSPNVDPMSISPSTVTLVHATTDAGVPFKPRFDGIANRIVAVFDTPQIDQPLVLRLSGATVDGGVMGPVSVARTTPQPRFVSSSVHGGIALSADDLRAGVAYSPRGPVAVGRYKGGTGSCATLACLTAFGLRSVEPAETPLTADTSPSPMRRAVAVGASVHAWLNNTNVATRTDGPSPMWSASLPQPPGPMFSDGLTLWSVLQSSTTLGVSQYFGTSWTSPFEPVATVGTTTFTPVRATGTIAGNTRYVMALDDSGKLFAWESVNNASFISRSQVASSITRVRIAATSSGVVAAVLDTGGQLLLYRWTGSWVQSGSSISSVSSFDLVARGETLYLATASGVTLQVLAIDGATMNRTPMSSSANTSNFATPSGILSVGDVELAAGDFGELAVAWSEQVSGGWRLYLSELR